MKPLTTLIVIYIIVVACIIGCACLFTSCEVLKGKSRLSSDSMHVSKSEVKDTSATNAGQVKKDESKTSEENEWWKKTYLYQPPKDPSVTNVYPSTVIYEGGKNKKDESRSSYDSAFLSQFASSVASMFDSTFRRIEQIEKSKHSETKGLSLWVIFLIALGGPIVIIFIKSLLSGFKIKIERKKNSTT